MRIVIDHGPAGEVHFIETDPTKYPLVNDPTAPGTFIPVTTFLTKMSGNVAMQQAGGWLATNQLPGEVAAITRWQRLLNAVNALPAADPLKALNLV